MSHFTRVKTKIVRKDLLIKSLLDLGHTCEEGELSVLGYGRRTVQVDIRASIGKNGSAVGFVFDGEVWECVADWYCVSGVTEEAFLGGLNRRYAYHATMETLQEEGFSVVVEERVGEDETVRLVLRRVV